MPNLLEESSTFQGLAVQLYSLRKESAQNFDAVLEGVAAQGFDAVEPFHLFGKSAREFSNRVETLGLQISSSHYPWGTNTDSNELADTLATLGLRRAIGGYMPDDLLTEDALLATIDKTNELVDALATKGMTLALHNHWWEFQPIKNSNNTELIYHRLQNGCPHVEFELDTYWAANFGVVDPADELAKVANRAPLLHVKDGPLIKGEPMVAVGAGQMDIIKVISAANPQVLEWLIVELDDCATNMSEAIGDSHRYITTRLTEEK